LRGSRVRVGRRAGQENLIGQRRYCEPRKGPHRGRVGPRHRVGHFLPNAERRRSVRGPVDPQGAGSRGNQLARSAL